MDSSMWREAAVLLVGVQHMAYKIVKHYILYSRLQQNVWQQVERGFCTVYMEYKNIQKWMKIGYCNTCRSTAHGLQDCKALGGERLLYSKQEYSIWNTIVQSSRFREADVLHAGTHEIQYCTSVGGERLLYSILEYMEYKTLEQQVEIGYCTPYRSTQNARLYSSMLIGATVLHIGVQYMEYKTVEQQVERGYCTPCRSTLNTRLYISRWI